MKKISYNFGAIRDSVAKLASMELMKENKSSTLDSFIKKTNESSNLKKQQLIFKNIEECKPFTKERLAERFLNQNLSIFRNVKWQDLIKENMTIRKDLLGGPDVSHVEARKGELCEAINILIESVSNTAFTNFEGESEDYDFIMEYLTREVSEGEESKEVDDAPELSGAWEFVTKLAVSNFNERYEHLNESEKEILSIMLSSNKEKEEYLEDIKNENIKIISSLLESNTIDRTTHDVLIEFKDKLERIGNISYIEIDDYILECIDLKQTLNEIE